jgi:predicted P-loop ATPase
MAMSSAWIVEWAELESMRGKESTQLKSFLSSSTDKYRRPYQRNVETVPRSAIIVGTTNNKEFLTDDTGNRRYWVLECNAKKIETIMHIRDQLWAEAVHLYKEGYPYHFEEEDLIAELEKQQEAHVVTDDWFEPVEAYVRTLSHTSIYEVLTEGLGLTADAAAGWKGRRIAKILKDLGWELKRTDKARRWVSPTAGTSSEKPPKGRGVFGTDAN